MRYLSLFSGIEAASVAWEPLGWEPIAFSEIEPFPCAVLEKRFPNVPNLGDVCEIDWKEFVGEHGKPKIIVGGSPCQSFSTSGKRTGLKGESGLMLEYIRAVQEVRPEWFVWENVPGALSSEGGEAFRCLLRSMDELGYGLAWRVLDAQFFGVAQRRRRVFLVGCLGNPERAAKVLFEPESLRWDYPSGRDKREVLAACAKRSARDGCAGFSYKASPGAGSIGFEDDVAPTILAARNDAAVCITQYSEGLAGTLTAARSSPCADRGENIICITPWDIQSKHVYAIDGPSPTLPSGKNEGMNIQPIVSYATCVAECPFFEDEYTWEEERLPGCYETLVEPPTCKFGVEPYSTTFPGTPCAVHAATSPSTVVRRLTPTECERLQGFPDEYTDVELNAKPASDTVRYKALGNSMAVPVMRWIGERIEEESQ